MNDLNTVLNIRTENHLYPFFWQHGECKEKLEDYVDRIFEVGIKALCIESRTHPDYLKEGWWRDLEIILSRCRMHGMKVWIFDDSHFPSGYVDGKVPLHPKLRKQYIDIRKYDVQGPLPEARIDLSFLKGFRFSNSTDDSDILKVILVKRNKEGKDSFLFDSFTDITDKLDRNSRLLTLDIPGGAYSVLTVYTTFQGGEETTKDHLNPLMKEATQLLIDEVYEAHYEHFKEDFGNTIEAFFSDEARFGNAKGTDCGIGKRMPLPWRQGMEADLSFDPLYLPLLWFKAEGKESYFRLSYMDYITEQYSTNYTGVLSEWCNSHGVGYVGHSIEDNGAHSRLGYGTGHFFRGQKGMDFAGVDVVYGQILPGMNYHHDGFPTGGMDGKFYHYALSKLAASAAHLEAKKKGRALCEAFGAYGWNEGLKMMKWIADHLMVRGINTIVPHAFSPAAFPDPDCPPHFYADGNNPQFRYFKYFSAYVNRVTSLFSNGFYPSSVGVFYHAESEWMGKYMPIEEVCEKLIRKQICFDIISEDYFDESSFEDGKYIINDHPFDVLVMPYSEFISYKMERNIDLLLKNNVSVIFIDEHPLGVLDFKKKFPELPCVSLSELSAILESYMCEIIEKTSEDLVVYEYINKDKKYYYLFNENIEEKLSIVLRKKENKQYCFYDAYTDELFTARNEEIILEPYESCIIVESDDLLCKKTRVTTDKKQNINQDWNVFYTGHDGQSRPLMMKRPGFVHRLEGLENECGTVCFNTEIILRKDSKTILEIDDVFETAEVLLNDSSCGVRICKPYRFDLSKYIKQGVNTLSIRVTNTLGTKIRDGFSHYLPIEPFGIYGDVKILTEE